MSIFKKLLNKDSSIEKEKDKESSLIIKEKSPYYNCRKNHKLFCMNPISLANKNTTFDTSKSFNRNWKYNLNKNIEISELVDGEDVFLNIYHVSKLNLFLECINLGVYHSSIETYAYEFSYGENDVIGLTGINRLHRDIVKPAIFHLKERILLGRTLLTLGDILNLTNHLGKHWTGQSYCPFNKNCNNFTEYFANLILMYDNFDNLMTLLGDREYLNQEYNTSNAFSVGNSIKAVSQSNVVNRKINANNIINNNSKNNSKINLHQNTENHIMNNNIIKRSNNELINANNSILSEENTNSLYNPTNSSSCYSCCETIFFLGKPKIKLPTYVNRFSRFGCCFKAFYNPIKEIINKDKRREKRVRDRESLFKIQLPNEKNLYEMFSSDIRNNNNNNNNNNNDVNKKNEGNSSNCRSNKVININSNIKSNSNNENNHRLLLNNQIINNLHKEKVIEEAKEEGIFSEIYDQDQDQDYHQECYQVNLNEYLPNDKGKNFVSNYFQINKSMDINRFPRKDFNRELNSSYQIKNQSANQEALNLDNNIQDSQVLELIENKPIEKQIRNTPISNSVLISEYNNYSILQMKQGMEKEKGVGGIVDRIDKEGEIGSQVGRSMVNQLINNSTSNDNNNNNNNNNHKNNNNNNNNNNNKNHSNNNTNNRIINNNSNIINNYFIDINLKVKIGNSLSHQNSPNIHKPAIFNEIKNNIASCLNNHYSAKNTRNSKHMMDYQNDPKVFLTENDCFDDVDLRRIQLSNNNKFIKVQDNFKINKLVLEKEREEEDNNNKENNSKTKNINSSFKNNPSQFQLNKVAIDDVVDDDNKLCNYLSPDKVNKSEEYEEEYDDDLELNEELKYLLNTEGNYDVITKTNNYLPCNSKDIETKISKLNSTLDDKSNDISTVLSTMVKSTEIKLIKLAREVKKSIREIKKPVGKIAKESKKEEALKENPPKQRKMMSSYTHNNLHIKEILVNSRFEKELKSPVSLLASSAAVDKIHFNNFNNKNNKMYVHKSDNIIVNNINFKKQLGKESFQLNNHNFNKDSCKSKSNFVNKCEFYQGNYINTEISSDTRPLKNFSKINQSNENYIINNNSNNNIKHINENNNFVDNKIESNEVKVNNRYPNINSKHGNYYKNNNCFKENINNDKIINESPKIIKKIEDNSNKKILSSEVINQEIIKSNIKKLNNLDDFDEYKYENFSKHSRSRSMLPVSLLIFDNENELPNSFRRNNSQSAFIISNNNQSNKPNNILVNLNECKFNDYREINKPDDLSKTFENAKNNNNSVTDSNCYIKIIENSIGIKDSEEDNQKLINNNTNATKNEKCGYTENSLIKLNNNNIINNFKEKYGNVDHINSNNKLKGINKNSFIIIKKIIELFKEVRHMNNTINNSFIINPNSKNSSLIFGNNNVIDNNNSKINNNKIEEIDKNKKVINDSKCNEFIKKISNNNVNNNEIANKEEFVKSQFNSKNNIKKFEKDIPMYNEGKPDEDYNNNYNINDIVIHSLNKNVSNNINLNKNSQVFVKTDLVNFGISKIEDNKYPKFKNNSSQTFLKELPFEKLCLTNLMKKYFDVVNDIEDFKKNKDISREIEYLIPFILYTIKLIIKPLYFFCNNLPFDGNDLMNAQYYHNKVDIQAKSK